MERALEEGLHFDGHPVRGIVQPALPGAILPVVAGIEPPRAADDETHRGFLQRGPDIAGKDCPLRIERTSRKTASAPNACFNRSSNRSTA
jgi:hypothetical protein